MLRYQKIVGSGGGPPLKRRPSSANRKAAFYPPAASAASNAASTAAAASACAASASAAATAAREAAAAAAAAAAAEHAAAAAAEKAAIAAVAKRAAAQKAAQADEAYDVEQEILLDDEVRRRRLLPLPFARSQHTKALPLHLRPIFGDDWRVFTAIDDSGDCFYHAVALALNSGGGGMRPPLTVTALRQMISDTLTPASFSTALNSYVNDLPDDSASAQHYATMSLGHLQNHVMTSHHYATRYDIRALSELAQLDVFPIVVNSLFGSRRSGVQSQHAAALLLPYQGHWQSYMRRPPARRRFVLLFHGSEHFQLLVRTTVLMAEHDQEAVEARAGINNTGRIPSWRALFSYDEVPVAVRDLFERTLD